MFSCLLVCLNLFFRQPSSLYLCLTLSVSASLPRCFGASLLCSLGTWLPSRIKCVCVFELCFSASSLIVHPLWFYFFLSCIIFSRFLVMLIHHPSSPMYDSLAVTVIIFIVCCQYIIYTHVSTGVSNIHVQLLRSHYHMGSFLRTAGAPSIHAFLNRSCFIFASPLPITNNISYYAFALSASTSHAK